MPVLARLAFTSFLMSVVAAQPTTDPAVLRQRLDDKLASAFLRAAPWHADFDAARRAAARQGKLVLAHFTRSFQPCGTSIRCEREVLSAPEFARLADRVVLYCHVTAHLDPAHDRALYEARGSGWPHHAVFDASGRLLGSHESYRDKSVDELARLVDRAQEYLRVEAETEAAMAAACRRRLVAGLGAGALDLAEARRLLACSGAWSAADLEPVLAGLTDLEVTDVLRRHDRFDAGAPVAAGAEFVVMWRAGKRPAARNASRDFWGGILLHLEKQEKPDLDLYRDGLRQLESLLGDSRAYRAFLEERRQALQSLEARRTSTGLLRHRSDVRSLVSDSTLLTPRSA